MSPVDTTEKPHTAVATLHRSAHHHHISLRWNLLDEYGPPHNRTFHVRLSIVHPTDEDVVEVFEGRNGSIKAAKQVAAVVALQKSSILKTKLEKQKSPLKKHQCIQSLIDDIPGPSGPRSEVYEISRLLQIKTNFIRLPSRPSTVLLHTKRENANNILSLLPSSDWLRPDRSNCCQTHLYRVALQLAGRQYVGESNSRSGAEQEASLSALKAIRRAILSLETSVTSTGDLLSSSFDSRVHIAPNSSVWRLKVLAAMHFEQPSFNVSEVFPDASDIPRTISKRTFKCVCSLQSFGSVEGTGPSKSIACKQAAEQMLFRLVHRGANPVKSLCASDGAPQKVTNRQQTSEHKTARQFKLDRADPHYGRFIHPVTRLDHVCSAKGLPKPIYNLANSQSSTLLNGFSNYHSVPEFIYEVQIGERTALGPRTGNKRLAKRLSAEAMLDQLGFNKTECPELRGVLRPPQLLPSLEVNVNHANCRAVESDTCSTQPTSHTVMSNIPTVSKPFSRSSLQPRHIEFSCTRDVLVFERPVCTSLMKPPGGHLGRLRSAKGRTTKTERQTNRHDATDIPDCDNDSPSSFSSIGHWSESLEAQTVGRSLSLRRSRSCSGVEPPHRQLSEGPRASVYGIKSRSTESLESAMPCSFETGLRLLSRIAVLCLEEHESETDPADATTSFSWDVTTQLLSFCQRLRIPCQFTDHPPNMHSVDQQCGVDNEPLHHTILSIGAAALSPCGLPSETPPSQSIVARGSGFSRDWARRCASLSACRQLAETKG